MANHVDPDGDDISELVMFRRDVEERLRADGVLCAEDQRVLEEFDTAFGRMSWRYRIRQSFERVIKNGLTRYTRDGAKDVGLALVVSDGDMPIVDVIPWRDQVAA